MPEVLSPQLQLAVRFEAMVKRADRGDEKALRITRQLVERLPELCDVYGNIADAAESALVDLYAGRSTGTRAALQRKLANMRVELAGPRASPLEKLLVERVVACWLQSYHADFEYVSALKGMPPKVVELHQRRQDRAARQYLKALRSLADVQRLLIPALQVNIAERQVNIAGADRATVEAPSRVRRPRDRPGASRAGIPAAAIEAPHPG